jgi:hypothetical protein
MDASCCTCMAWGIAPPHASVAMLALCAMAHASAGARGRSSEVETFRARRRLVVGGGDLSCEAETCRGDPSYRELVGDATNWPETRRLASVGLDRGP